MSCVVRVREDLLHPLERFGRADSGNHVLALRVHEELAVDALLAGRRVAREAHAGGGAVALVAEDHLDDVHRGAEVVRDVVRAAVDLRARRLPRVEDGADGAAQLLARVLRERAAELLVVDRLERRRRARAGRPRRGRCPARRPSPPSARRAPTRSGAPSMPSTTSPYIWISRRYESSANRAFPVVRARPSTAASFSPRLRIVSIIPGMEIAAPERTDTSSGPLGVAEAEPAALLEAADVIVDLLVEAGRDVVRGHVGAARVGRDREARGDGDPELRHLGEADALAAEELATAVGRLLEAVDVPGGGGDVGHRTDLS